jgi:peptidoglycan/LPS O-acetylase OafA/YrhL
LYNIISFCDLGAIGVRLFFILSGFLITFLLIDEFEKKGKILIKHFFIRRALRIFPCFYAYLIALIFLKIFGIIDITSDTILWAFLYIQNFNVFQLENAFSSSWLVIHSWSLSVEEQFYIIYPFIFKLIKPFANNKLHLLIIGSFLVGAFFRTFNYSFPNISRITGGSFLMHSDYLIWGCCIAFGYKKYKEIAFIKISQYKYLFLIIAIILSVFASKYEFVGGFYAIFCGSIILISNAYVLVFFLLFPNSGIGKVMEYKPLIFIGKLSYSLYVWQQLFLGSTSLWLKYQFLTIFPVNIVMVIGCALVSYYVIEIPFLRLKSKFSTTKFSNH